MAIIVRVPLNQVCVLVFVLLLCRCVNMLCPWGRTVSILIIVRVPWNQLHVRFLYSYYLVYTTKELLSNMARILRADLIRVASNIPWLFSTLVLHAHLH